MTGYGKAETSKGLYRLLLNDVPQSDMLDRDIPMRYEGRDK